MSFTKQATDASLSNLHVATEMRGRAGRTIMVSDVGVRQGEAAVSNGGDTWNMSWDHQHLARLSHHDTDVSIPFGRKFHTPRAEPNYRSTMRYKALHSQGPLMAAFCKPPPMS